MEPIPLKALLDTHALVWAILDPEALGEHAHALLKNYTSAELAIADVTLLEVALLAHKNRLTLNESVESLLLDMTQLCQTLPITPAIAGQIAALPLPHPDPFDRTIVATALHHNIPLITKDRKIIESGCVETIW